MNDNKYFWLNREKPSETYYISFVQKCLNFCACTFWIPLKNYLRWLLSLYSLLSLPSVSLWPLPFCWICSARSSGISFEFSTLSAVLKSLFFLLETSFSLPLLLLCFIVFISHPPFLSLILCLGGTLVSFYISEIWVHFLASPLFALYCLFLHFLALSIRQLFTPLFCLGLLWVLVYVS